MDGGACSTDAFRMPEAGEELTTPFSEFVVRYGQTARLARNTAAIAGVTAELSPRMEEPYRLIYFVVTDQMRTTIAALRAVLKEGLEAPFRLPKAFIIDELHTLEVFRKQGLATSLTNFVKGIAEAHGIELFASSGVFTRSFWEVRGFEEVTAPEMLSACSLEEDVAIGASNTLLRAGAAYTEYQPANGERLSIIRPFYHSGDGYLGASAAASPLGSTFLGQESPAKGGHGSSKYSEGSGGDAAAPAAGTQGDPCDGVEGGVAGDTALLSPSRFLTNERLARHDEEEKAKSLKSTTDMLAQTKMVMAAMLTTPSDAAAAKAAAGGAQERSALMHTIAAGWPGMESGAGLSSLLPPTRTGGSAAAAALAATSGIDATGAGYLGWTSSGREIEAGTSTAAGLDKRAMAARGLLAIPSSGLGDGVVDLTGVASLAEQDEEQMQLAIAMSLSAAEAEATGGGGNFAAEIGGVRRGVLRGGGGVTSAGEDTETEEDADYGAHLSGGETDSGDVCTAAIPADEAQSRGGRRSSKGGSQRRAEVDGSGSDGSACDGDRRARRGSRGPAENGHARDNNEHNEGNDSRRIRRRRDESGTSAPGEQSLDGADGAAPGGGVEMDLEEDVGMRRDVTGRHRSNGGGRGAGDDKSYNSLVDVCMAAANGVDKNCGLGKAGSISETCSLAPRPRDATAAAAAAARKGTCPSSPARSVSPCHSAASSCSFSVEPSASRRVPAVESPEATALATTVETLGHRDPNSTMGSFKQQNQNQGIAAYHPPARRPPRGQQPQHQHEQQSSLANEMGGGAAAEASGLGAGGSFISDDIETNEIMMRDFGVAADALDGGGRLDDKLITVANWQGDDNDEEMRRVMEASRLSHEQEMLQRATRESQEAAVTAAAAAMHLPHPPSQAAAAPPSLSFSIAPGQAFLRSGGGPDATVPPALGSFEQRTNSGKGHSNTHGSDDLSNGTMFPGIGCGAAGANGFRMGAAGGVADSSAAPTPAWVRGWDDGEAVYFAGKGKGKGRCRD